MRLIKVDRSAWLVGLQWYVPPINASIAEIRDYVEEEHGDSIVRRGIQIGYGQSGGNSALSGKRSLAAWISLPVNSFTGIFSLVDDLTDESFWWLFARINGNNMSGFGDACFDTLEEAEVAREELIDLLPPDAEIDENLTCSTERESLAWLRPRCEISLMARLSGQAIVKPVTAFKSEKSNLLKRGIWATTGIVALCFAGYYGYEGLTKMGMTAKAREHAQEIQRKRMEYERHPEKIFDQKWQAMINGGDTSAACVNQMAAINLNYAGWEFAEATCSPNGKTPGLKVDYAHTPLAAYRYIPKNAQLGGKDNKGGEIKRFSMNTPLPVKFNPMKGPFYTELPKREDVRRLFLELAQTYNLKIAVSFSSPEQKTIEELGTFKAPWSKGSFSLQNMDSIQVVGVCEFLKNIPALAVNRVQYDRKKWTISGEMYAL